MRSNVSKERGYCLIFVPFMGQEDYSFVYRVGRSLEELDSFTKNFQDLKEMMSCIERREGNEYDVISVYIQRLNSKHSTCYQVMYAGDCFDESKVISVYVDYLLAHPKYFCKKSPARFVNLHRSDYELESTYIQACCFSYFNRENNYREVRGAYFELKELGLASKVVISKGELDSDHYDYYSSCDYVNSLLNGENGPDWESIHNYLSAEDIERLVKRYPNPDKGYRK